MRAGEVVARLGCVVIGCAIGSTATATPPQAAPWATAVFKLMDGNQDGRLSSQEHAAGARRLFETMDADRDGRVTAAELDAAGASAGTARAAGEPSAAEKIRAMDADGDGVLRADEYDAATRAMFTAMDANHDGVLSTDELMAGRRADPPVPPQH